MRRRRYLYGLKALLEIVNSALAEYLLVAVLAGYTLYSFSGEGPFHRPCS